MRAPNETGAAPAATIWWSERPSVPGTYSSDALVAAEARLLARGVSADDARRRAYAPFIIGGPAQWSDTWGGVRRSLDGGLRPHLGQDVFCRYGDPVLASDAGPVAYGSDPLGGLVARLYRGDGGYWYYAHLSGIPSGMSSGAVVRPGDVIGYCGTSGNAAGTPPHVHFGSYAGGVATNPMTALVGWLRAAAARHDIAGRGRRGSLRPRPSSPRPQLVVTTDATKPPCAGPEAPVSWLSLEPVPLGRDAWARMGIAGVTAAATPTAHGDPVEGPANGSTLVATGRTGAVDATASGARVRAVTTSNRASGARPTPADTSTELTTDARVGKAPAAGVSSARDAGWGRTQQRSARSLAGASLAATKNVLTRGRARQPDGFDAMVRRTGRRIPPRGRRR